MISAMVLVSALPVSAQVSAAQASELRAEIVRTESLRVIVTVSIPGVQAGESGAAPKASQQQVLRALEGTEHQVVFVFPSTPVLALIVGPGALGVLLSHPLVTSITIDRPRKPSGAHPGEHPRAHSRWVRCA